jgi:hypothetical protein
MKVALLVVGIVALVSWFVFFEVLKQYYCPVCGTWHRLGKDATLISQFDGSYTLCHDDRKGGTDCHSFRGGFYGLEANSENSTNNKFPRVLIIGTFVFLGSILSASLVASIGGLFTSSPRER